MDIQESCEGSKLTLELSEDWFAKLSDEEKVMAQNLAGKSFKLILELLLAQFEAARFSGPLMVVYFSQVMDKLCEVGTSHLELIKRWQSGEDPYALYTEYFLARVNDNPRADATGSSGDHRPSPFDSFINSMDL